MKVAGRSLPRKRELNLPKVTCALLRWLLRARCGRLLLLSTLLACSGMWWFRSTLSTMMSHAMVAPAQTARPRSLAKAETRPAQEAQPRKPGWLGQILSRITAPPPPASRVLPFDGSRQLRRGDKVVVSVEEGVMVAEVAGTPNESVLLRRGPALEKLYVLGDNSYAVIANQRSRIVRTEDIYATVDVGADLARN